MARHHRRTARTWLVAVAAASLLTACGSAAPVASSDDGGSDASAAPSAPVDPSPSVAASDAATPAAAGTDAPTADSSAASATSPTDLTSALVEAADLPRPEAAFTWAVGRDDTRPRGSARLFDPCQPTDYPTDGERTEVVVRDLRVEESGGGGAPETALVRQNVARYPSAEVASEAYDGFARVATECAESTGSDGTVLTTEVLDDGDGSLLIQSTPQIGLYTSYAIVAQRGDVVTLAAYTPGEVRDADEQARAVAKVVGAALADAD